MLVTIMVMVIKYNGIGGIICTLRDIISGLLCVVFNLM